MVYLCCLFLVLRLVLLGAVSCCWCILSMFVACWLLLCRLLLFERDLLLVVCCAMRVACSCLLFVACYLLSGVRCSLLVVC